MPTVADSLPLVATKLYRPRIIAGLVPRPCLLPRRDRPLTLVVALAGVVSALHDLGYSLQVLKKVSRKEKECRKSMTCRKSPTKPKR